MIKILVLYYSKHGRTQKLAQQIAAGIEQSGAEAVIRTVPEVSSNINNDKPSVPEHGHLYVSKNDLTQCQALALGSPAHFGNMAAPMKYFIDSLSDIWLKGSLVNKPACVFTSSSSMHGGQETTLLSMMLPLFHHGMCILGLPYLEPELHSTVTGCSPYGVSSVSVKDIHDLSHHEKVLALAMGTRLAQHAVKLNA